jgi:hypothetical protein
MPNWTTLFTSPSDCECQDCNSVFSPASYLVDIMQYLDNCPSNNGTGDSVLQVLLKRRPDIGNLLLTCENTNTEIPYIDLVNEIMEYYVLHYDQVSRGLPAPTMPPDPALARDTGRATAEELKAEPQYILLDAYKALYQQVYPFNLPYNQPLDVIRTYLGFLKTSRAELLQVFRYYPGPPPNAAPTPIPRVAIDAEMLQLSLMEYEILTNSDFSGTGATPKPTVTDYFGDSPSIKVGFGIPASVLLQQTGLLYTDLLALLETNFVNPGHDALNVLQNLVSRSSSLQVAALYAELKANTWQPDTAFVALLADAGIAKADFEQWLTANFPKIEQVITLYEAESDCDLTKTFLYSIQCLYETPPAASSTQSPVADSNITEAFLSRLHRFIRLWRKTGWTIHELDSMITALGETDITPLLIHKLAVALDVNTILNLPPLQLACIWGDIDTFGDNSANSPAQSLYAQLFLRNTGTITTSGSPEPNVFGPDPLSGLLTSTPVPQLSDHLPEIFAALGISAGDYAAIVADVNPGNTDLSLANLSTLYRYKLLASALGVSISDLCLLKSCLSSNAFTAPDGTFDFLQQFVKFKSSGFEVDVLNYVLTGSSKAIDDIALSQQTILAAFPTLRDVLSKIDSDNPNPNSDPNIAAKVKQLKVTQVASSISSLTGLDTLTINALIGSDIDTLIGDLSTFGLGANYFNNTQWTDPPALQRIDGAINFAWGVNAPDPAVSADKFTVRWTGWICPPADGDYTFTIQITEPDESAALWINDKSLFGINRPDITGSLSGVSGQGTISLKGGTLYPIKVEYAETIDTAGIQLFWQSATSPKAIVRSHFLYPDTIVQDLVGKVILYHRAAQCIDGFRLSAAEANYLLTNTKDFGNITFLPTNTVQWLRLCDYTELRKIIPAKLLLPIFQEAVAEDAASSGSALPSDSLVSAIANANQPGWNKDYLSYLAGNQNTPPPSPTASYFQYKASDFRNEIGLLRIKEALDLAIKTKMPVNATGLPSWTTIETNATTSVDMLHSVAEQIKNAVKAKYKDHGLTIATELNNGIRENQKQALISYLLTLNLAAPDGNSNVTDADGLYEYLLLDVEMMSAVVTSRLIQATMAVQLFADRCLLGLESQVQPDPQMKSSIDPTEWEWMKHYSVSAGLKKLFVYVENYLHPSLRDDKSAFFRDFESALKKGDITADNVESAFRDYLHKLNQVSNMEACGMYHDTATQTLHVFARTHAAPYNYYYRVATAPAGANSNSWTWSPWEPVQLDIKSIDDDDNSGVHLMPVVWKKRLFLFWPEFTEKTVQPPRTETFQQLGNAIPDVTGPQKYWEVRLAWSEYANGKWTPKQLSKEIATPFLGKVAEPSSAFLPLILMRLASTRPRQFVLRSAIGQDDTLNVTILIRYAGQQNNLSIFTELVNFANDAVPVWTFTLSDPHDKITSGDTTNIIDNIYLNYSYLQQSEIDLLTPNFYQPFFQSLSEQNKLSIAASDFLRTTIIHKLLFSNDVTIPDFEESISHPFFYTDTENNRTYFATPATIARRGPIFPGLNQVAVFKNAASAHLRMFNSGATSNVVVSASESAVAVRPIEPVAPSASNEIAGGLSPQKAIAFTASSRVLPAINNLDAGTTNQYLIGRLAAGGAAQYLSDVNPYRSPLFGGGDIYIPRDIFGDDGLAFYTFYHPFASIFVKKLNEQGVPAVLAADTAEFAEDSNYPNIDMGPTRLANDQGNTFQNAYNPNFADVQSYIPADGNRKYYLENLDFSEYGTYSCYNWELFFHAPFLVATTLSKNGKYAEARQWFHYIFNPLSTEPASTNPNSPFWQVLPFKTASDEEIQSYIAGLQPGYDVDPNTPTNPDANQQIDAWRADPYNAFKTARLRPIAFMKNVVMAYLDNLIKWGDDLFRTYTRENINEATQLYVMAAKILGPAPQYIPQRGTIDSYSYNQLKAAGLDDFGDALVQLENVFPNSSDVQQTDNSVPQNLLGIGKAFYFCIPPNDNLLQYWTKIGDRLFKIRHGQNIDGIVVPLALYQPPIDPELLLQAKAQGVDLASILAEVDVSAPFYRFSYLLQKAKEFCNEVVSLGGALLAANEKHDAEELSRLRQTQEISLLNMVAEIKSRQVLEAQANLDNLASSRSTAIQKLRHYVEELLGNQATQVPDVPTLPEELNDNSSLPQETIINQVTSSIDITLTGTDEAGVKIIPKEKQEMDFSALSTASLLNATSKEMLAGVLRLIPQFSADIKPIGVGAGTGFGGVQLGALAELYAKSDHSRSSLYSFYSSYAARMAGFIRREQDWVFQANMTAREIVQLDKQIIAAQIRLQMAQHELDNHKQQIQNAQDIEQFLETKFSNQELYQWMIDKLQDVHKQGYQLAYDMARQAEKAYRFELGVQESNFVQYGYYNDAYLGITAGEQLQLALKQMDAAYLENNVREFELTKHISLKQVNPLALLQLIETGTCSFDLAEQLFDMDYPGHYFRRIKSVGITIPCVAGPYTTVNSTLRLSANRFRINTDITGGYPIKTSGPDARFVTNSPPFLAIATSAAQNDSGVFELSFRDERYLPFEGAGAIGTWQLELNGKYQNNGTITDFSQFNYDTITDVIVHVRYTAREAEESVRQAFRAAAVATLPPASLTQLFSLRHDFPTQWQAFLNQPDSTTGDQTCEVPILSERIPYFLSKSNANIVNIGLYGEASAPLPTFQIISPAPASKVNSGFSFKPDPSFGALQVSTPSGQSWGDNNLGIWKIVKPGKPVLSASDVEDIYCLVTYAIG